MTDEPDLCDDEGCPQHGTPHVCLDVDDLLGRLARATVASCTCMVKTDDPEHHERTCRYRVLCEAIGLITLLLARPVPPR